MIGPPSSRAGSQNTSHEEFRTKTIRKSLSEIIFNHLCKELLFPGIDVFSDETKYRLQILLFFSPLDDFPFYSNYEEMRVIKRKWRQPKRKKNLIFFSSEDGATFEPQRRNQIV